MAVGSWIQGLNSAAQGIKNTSLNFSLLGTPLVIGAGLVTTGIATYQKGIGGGIAEATTVMGETLAGAIPVWGIVAAPATRQLMVEGIDLAFGEQYRPMNSWPVVAGTMAAGVIMDPDTPQVTQDKMMIAANKEQPLIEREPPANAPDPIAPEAMKQRAREATIPIALNGAEAREEKRRQAAALEHPPRPTPPSQDATTQQLTPEVEPQLAIASTPAATPSVEPATAELSQASAAESTPPVSTAHSRVSGLQLTERMVAILQGAPPAALSAAKEAAGPVHDGMHHLDQTTPPERPGSEMYLS